MTDLTAPSWQRDLSIDQQLALRTAATRLAGEFDGIYGSETIERFLHSSYDRFPTVGSTPDVLPLPVERFARDDLERRVRALLDDPGVPARS